VAQIRSQVDHRGENEAALVEQQFNAAWTNATVKLRMEDL